MSNQEAIALLRNLEDSLDAYCELNEEGKTAFRMAIEALNCSEFPNSSDCISRQAAIEAIDRYYKDKRYITRSRTILSAICRDMKSTMDSLPSAQPEQRWIPCSERLPEEKERSYWVCLETGGQCQCRWTNDMYGLGANKWSKWGWHIMDKPQYSKIVAWMPLPEPYREDIE